METTTNFNLKEYESGDFFNPLTVENANMEILDTVVKGVSDRSIGRATELVSQGVHAITLIDTATTTFRFIATSNFTAGETFTLNGIQIDAYLPSGEDLGTGAYVTGAVVIASLNADSSAMTVYVPQGSVAVASDSERLGGELPSYYATKSYADGIKNTADSASALIQRKALVNTYYDTSTHKLYVVNSDGTQGGEIKMSRLLDFVNAVTLNTVQGVVDYTTQRDGVLIVCVGATANANAVVQCDGVTVCTVVGSASTRFSPTVIPDIPANTHVITSASVQAYNGDRYIQFIPYK